MAAAVMKATAVRSVNRPLSSGFMFMLRFVSPAL